MSGKGGGNNGKDNSGISGIPAGSRKMVQSLKEIVNNYTELEIYAALKECNMDPNEAVNRLISQDPFHEVKSKREKKKENKDVTDPRSRGGNNSSNRGTRGSVDRYSGRGGSNQFSSNEPLGFQGKPAFKKENGTYAYGGSSSTSAVAANNTSRRTASYSESVATENKMPAVSAGDGMLSSLQPPSGFQSPWVGVPGQVSLADIVKMGRPQGKASFIPNPSTHSANRHYVPPPPLVAPNQNLHQYQDHGSKVPEAQIQQGISSCNVHPDDEWPSIEHPLISNISPSVESAAELTLSADRINQRLKSRLDEIEVAEDRHIDAEQNHIVHATSSGSNMQDDVSEGALIFDNNLYNDVTSYQPHGLAFEHNEAEDGSASAVEANLQQLSLQKNDHEAPPEEDNPSVVIPNHLQLHTPECLQLSFGSFGSGNNAPESIGSRPIHNDSEETSALVDVSAIGHSETRNAEYFADEHLRTATDENLVHRTGPSAGDYNSPSVSQGEVLIQEMPEPGQGTQYSYPTSAPGFTYEGSHLLNSSLTHPQTTSQMQNSQMQNLAAFSSVMQAYTNSLPSTLLASNVPTTREDLPYSPFLMAQSMPTKYDNVASSISSSTISMSEVLRAGGISVPQPTQQIQPGANVAAGPALPQHLAVHPYSQPTLPLGHYANMIGYPFLPQSYAYMPSAFQQAFAGNSSYPQSLAAMLPPYKNSVSVSSLPQSAAVASGYGFGSSTNIPGGNFPLNPPTAPTGTTIGYEDVVNSQYKDSNHLMSLQQNDNSAMWVHGPGSRAMSAVPANTYYGFQGQNQQHGGFRQGQQQQPSQQFGAPSYPNFYQSQAGISLEQQQNARDVSLGGAQGQPSKQSQQIWQNNY